MVLQQLQATPAVTPLAATVCAGIGYCLDIRKQGSAREFEAGD
jgi:hypothetical protein